MEIWKGKTKMQFCNCFLDLFKDQQLSCKNFNHRPLFCLTYFYLFFIVCLMPSKFLQKKTTEMYGSEHEFFCKLALCVGLLLFCEPQEQFSFSINRYANLLSTNQHASPHTVGLSKKCNHKRRQEILNGRKSVCLCHAWIV